MAIQNKQYKKVAVGIAAATVGAAAIGAVHYMFLAQQLPTLPPDVLGIPTNVLLPVVLGGVVIASSILATKNEMLKAILLSGGSVAIGYGVAEYAGWLSQPPILRARAPVVRRAPVYPVQTPTSEPKIIGSPIIQGAMVI